MTYSMIAFFKNLFGKKTIPDQSFEEKGFVDLDFPITEITFEPTGATRCKVRGNVAGVDVGLAVVLHSEWNPQPLVEHGATFYWGTGNFQRTGPESDRFVSLLRHIYSLPAPDGPAAMLDNISVQVVGLNSDPSKAKDIGARMKMFFHYESEDGQRYAEVFTNINIEKGVLEFHEKDNEYRLPLVRAFCNDL